MEGGNGMIIRNWEVPHKRNEFVDFPNNDKWYIYKIGYFLYFLLYGKSYDKTGCVEL